MKYFRMETFTLAKLIGEDWYKNIIKCYASQRFNASFVDKCSLILVPEHEINDLLRRTKPFKSKECYK